MQTNLSALEDILKTTQNVTLVAATKYVNSQELAILYENGITIFGENRVQAFLEKYQTYKGPATWHFIGNLQTNKVKDIIDKVSLIHSVNSIRLIDEIQKQAARHNKQMPILLEVNIAQEKTKQGFIKKARLYKGRNSKCFRIPKRLS